MRIGELAEKAGVTPRTIRYYENLGLMGCEREGKGFRYYSAEHLVRLQKIDNLKKLGLSLEEINEVIHLYFSDPTGFQGKQKLLTILQQHLAETEEKLKALEQFRSELQINIANVQQHLEQIAKAQN
ncbi:MerR family transcriptional regulator [Leptolyngbya sp. FACHB-261]|nr:MerR family transcriptional regulator [Leptolyngbya sp. FACHB-261]